MNPSSSPTPSASSGPSAPRAPSVPSAPSAPSVSSPPSASTLPTASTASTAPQAHAPSTFLGLCKLPARSAAWVMPLLLSLLMTFIVSLISTLRVAGFSMEVLRLWMSSWALSWMVAFPTLLLVLPLVRRATAAIVEAPR